MRRGAIVVAGLLVLVGIVVSIWWAVGDSDSGEKFDTKACFDDPTAARADVETQQPRTFLTLQEVSGVTIGSASLPSCLQPGR